MMTPLEFKSDVFSESYVNSLLEKWSAQIREATMEAKEIHNDAITLDTWGRQWID